MKQRATGLLAGPRTSLPVCSGRVGPAIVAAVLLWSGPAVSQEPFGPRQNPLAGADVFGSKNCIACHAINGLGGRGGPDLGQISGRRSFYQLAAAVWNHIPDMRQEMRERGIAAPRMSAREVGDLIAFLFTLDYFDPPGDPGRGKRLFREKRCVRCHQVGGVGGVVGPNLDFLAQYGSPILVAAAMWNHGPAMSETMRRQGIERPTFTASELRDLIEYLESASTARPGEPMYVLPGRADEGRRTFRARNCIECHSVRGRGGDVGPDLARRGLRSELEFAAAMWNKAPRMKAAMEARNIVVPRLDAEEMADIVAYLYSVQYFAEAGSAEAGRRLVRSKGCLSCHSLDGRGGDTAPDLSDARGLNTPAGAVAALWSHWRRTFPADEEAVWPAITPEEMAALTAFLQQLNGGR